MPEGVKTSCKHAQGHKDRAGELRLGSGGHWGQI